MPRFDVEGFHRLLRARVLGQRCHAFEVLDSTNTFLYELGKQGEPEGTIVLADEQTAGRGQAHKVWISPPQCNLYVSVLLRPRIAPTQAPLLSLLTAVALVDTLRQEGASCGIKWPNDVLIQGRKVAGILAEMDTDQETVRFVVVGIGVNVNMTEADLQQHLAAVAQPATSLRLALGRAISREAVLAALMASVETWYHRFIMQGDEDLRGAWEARSLMHGRRIRARTPASTWEGMAGNIDRAGRLGLRQDDGSLLWLTSAEVRFLDGPGV